MVTKRPSSSLRRVSSQRSLRAASPRTLCATPARFRLDVGQQCSHRRSASTFSYAYVLQFALRKAPSDTYGPQGLVDLDAEIAKCEKKLQLAKLNLDKVRKVEAQSDYVETVPANVRLSNEDRVRLSSTLLYVF